MKTHPMDLAAAEEIAISALGFIGADATLLQRFLALTGISAADLRRAAAEPGFLAGVLRFVAAHEPTLLAFAGSADVRPEAVREALRILPGGDDRHEQST